MPASLDLTAPKLGSGARFRKLSTTLAARGAKDPDALAAFIGRRKLGNAGMGRLSAGKSLANPDLGIYLAETTTDNQGKSLTCPECGHIAPAGKFGVSGTDVQAKPAVLRTPSPSTAGVRKGVPLTVKGGASNTLANSARSAIELATGTVRHPVRQAEDVRVDLRQHPGVAILKHRNGGAEIGRLRKTGEGKWVASVNGKDLAPHTHQRAALMEAVGTYNGAVKAAVRPQEAPLQPAPVQTELMAEYGIPAQRSAAFATPTTSSGAGPRVTRAAGTYDPDHDGDNDATVAGDTDKDGPGGLNPKGQAIYKKLIAKGLPPARALILAKNSQNAKPGAFGKSGS